MQVCARRSLIDFGKESNSNAGLDGRKLRPVKFTAAITREDGCFVARCLEVEVASQGKTVEEAQANLQEALELLYEDQPLPTGIEQPIITTLELSA